MSARSTFVLVALAGLALSFVDVSAALAVKASPPTCRYGGTTCMVCDEFEVVPPRRPGQRSRNRCVKCVPDQSNPNCSGGQYCPNGKDKNGVCFF
jgi:hypothetical protein